MGKASISNTRRRRRDQMIKEEETKRTVEGWIKLKKGADEGKMKS